MKPDIQDATQATKLTDVQGNIEFRNVSFKYREGYEHVLRNVSLNIKAGEYIALVGPSGAGKTTLCSLIPRFYEVNAGEICIDGKNVKHLTLASLRKRIGLVQQDVCLFSDSAV